MSNYIYLLQEREFINTKKNIYKLGKTKQENLQRFKQYPKGSQLLLQQVCDDCDVLEMQLIRDFKNKYIHRKDIGTEYFEGDFNEMIKDIQAKIAKTLLHNEDVNITIELLQSKIQALEKQKAEEQKAYRNTIEWNMEQLDDYFQKIENVVNTKMTTSKNNLLKHERIVSGELKLENELILHESVFKLNEISKCGLFHEEKMSIMKGKFSVIPRNHIIEYIYKILKCLFNFTKTIQNQNDNILSRLDKLEKENYDLKRNLGNRIHIDTHEDLISF